MCKASGGGSCCFPMQLEFQALEGFAGSLLKQKIWMAQSRFPGFGLHANASLAVVRLPSHLGVVFGLPSPQRKP